MSPERQSACNKQLTRGNSPQQTRPTPEQKKDFSHPSTGFYYRRSLISRGFKKLP